MTPQQLKAMKLALEALEYLGTMHFQHTGEALYQETFTAIEDALSEHAMQETQRLGQEIEQEPVAWWNYTGTHIDLNVSGRGTPLYAVPPQQKPLTHPQIHEFDWPDGVSFEDILLFVRAIEAAHGIKENT